MNLTNLFLPAIFAFEYFLSLVQQIIFSHQLSSCTLIFNGNTSDFVSIALNSEFNTHHDWVLIHIDFEQNSTIIVNRYFKKLKENSLIILIFYKIEIVNKVLTKLSTANVLPKNSLHLIFIEKAPTDFEINSSNSIDYYYKKDCNIFYVFWKDWTFVIANRDCYTNKMNLHFSFELEFEHIQKLFFKKCNMNLAKMTVFLPPSPPKSFFVHNYANQRNLAGTDAFFATLFPKYFNASVHLLSFNYLNHASPAKEFPIYNEEFLLKILMVNELLPLPLIWG